MKTIFTSVIIFSFSSVQAQNVFEVKQSKEQRNQELLNFI